MAAFFIVPSNDQSAAACQRLDELHRQHGFALSRRISVDGFLLYLYRKLDGHGGHYVEFGRDRFACLVGQLVYRGASGIEGLRRYCADLERQELVQDQAIGQFALLHKNKDGLRIVTDAYGFNQVYVNESAGIATSSFWALLELLPKITVDPSGVYEYAWNGTTFGAKTFVREIRRLPPGSFLAFDQAASVIRTTARAPSVPSAVRKFDSYVEEHCERLKRLFNGLATAFGDKLHVSFSGGYDSRLMLAGLIAAGLRPRLFVYGKEHDRDVAIGRQIASQERLSIDVIDKFPFDMKSDDWLSQQQSDFVLFDTWKVDGIFDNASDAFDRLRRHDDGRIPLNGSLGEIYRNFFYIPDRALALKDVVSSFFSTYDPRACTDQFSVADYTDELVKTFQSELGSTETHVTRSTVESLYPLIRGRYWTGRDANINSRFGRMVFPFMQAQLIEGTSDIPVQFKNHGRLEGAMIARLSPSIARHPSVYGHRFSDPPTLAHRAKNWLTLFRPPWLRRYSYRLRFSRPQPRPDFLSTEKLGQCLDVKLPYTRRYFHADRIHDPDAFNRVVTMEYIFQKYDARE